MSKKVSNLMYLLVTSMFVLAFAVGPAMAGDKVDCDKGGSIQQKLDKAKEGDTIAVSGACTEDIVISKDRIILDCESLTNASITGTGAGTLTIQIQGGNVTVRNCTISGGANFLGAITVTRNGSAVFENNKITAGTSVNASGVGVAQNSYGRLTGNEIIGGVNGVIVTAGSMADLFQNIITGATTGIAVINSASADIVDNTITGPAGPGITPNTTGVLVSRTSTANFSNDVIFGVLPNTIQKFATGIGCSAFSVVRFGFGFGGPTVPQNPGTGNTVNLGAQPIGAPLGGCAVQGMAF